MGPQDTGDHREHTALAAARRPQKRSHSCLSLELRIEKKAIGILNLYFIRLPSGLMAVIEDLVIDEPYRRWGVGPLLVKKAIEMAKARKARHISLRTNPKRVEANKLYLAMGFHRMETNFYRINLFK